jgi:osomolarity two-component system sensor histidine kinase TcsA
MDVEVTKSVHNLQQERKLLIVDDNIVNQKVILNVLKKIPNLKILVANNGKEAVQIAKTVDLDIILMDCIMVR